MTSTDDLIQINDTNHSNPFYRIIHPINSTSALAISFKLVNDEIIDAQNASQNEIDLSNYILLGNKNNINKIELKNSILQYKSDMYKNLYEVKNPASKI